MQLPDNAFGTPVKEADLTKLFLSGPRQYLVQMLLRQLAAVKGFSTLFGPYKMTPQGEKDGDQQRWADYQRQDWQLRQLPVINVMESGTEQRSSDQGFLTGSVQIQVFWPASFRRGDLARVPAAFTGALQNFFSSRYARDMIDEHYSIHRPMKVPGLNELGKTLSWSPNMLGVIETDSVPATIVDVSYRIDLRAWKRAMAAMGRTQCDPFEVTLQCLEGIDIGILGISDAEKFAADGGPDADVALVENETINISNP